MTTQSKWGKIFSLWFPGVLIITMLAGLAYGVAQQVFRHLANDPQIQMAEDTAAALALGSQPETLIPSNKIEIGESLAPYLIIYDETGKPVIGNGVFHQEIPLPPSGVFDHARVRQNRLTWQPKPGVRSAIVVQHFSGRQSGFVLAGRSLQETEQRVNQMQNLVLLGWLAMNLVLLGWYILFKRLYQ
ncbi:MAG TPA: hypothetical protein VHY08_05715 [Bacillota bacterium]|nr:hypothetical protein [Bacillota bacterium]